MTFTFRPATRENVPLLIGVAGGTGSGKTFSALRIATGLAGGARFAVLDTENGRAKHYADQFSFDVADLAAPFTPAAYADAIETADRAGYPVIVVDSASHEHAGDGGLLDMHDAEFERMGHKESSKMAAWIKPKSEHKRMVSRLLQVKAHVILCFRAEEKVEMRKNPQTGRMEVVPKASLTGLGGWIPIAEKSLPYELTLSFLLTADAPGIPKPIKLQEQHKAIVPLDKPLDESVGRALGEWAAGSSTLSPADVASRDPGLEGPTARASAGESADAGGSTAHDGALPYSDDENVVALRAELHRLAAESGADVGETERSIVSNATSKTLKQHVDWLSRCIARVQKNLEAKKGSDQFPIPEGART